MEDVAAPHSSLLALQFVFGADILQLTRIIEKYVALFSTPLLIITKMVTSTHPLSQQQPLPYIEGDKSYIYPIVDASACII